MKTLVSYLEDHGFTKVTQKTRLQDLPAWFIFRVTGTDYLYVYRSIGPVYFLKKYRMWLNRGTLKNLPKPVGRLVDFNKPIHRRVSLHCIQSDIDMDDIKEELSKSYILLGQKEYSRPDATSVMIVRTVSDPHYYRIVKYTRPKLREYAINELRDRAMNLINFKSVVRNGEFYRWCVRNREDIENLKFDIIDLCVEEDPIMAMKMTADYILGCKDHRVNLFTSRF